MKLGTVRTARLASVLFGVVVSVPMASLAELPVYHVRDLGGTGGIPVNTSAWDMNDAGEVTGVSWTGEAVPPETPVWAINAPFFWDGDTMHDLGLLPGTGKDGYGSAINALGQVTGASGTCCSDIDQQDHAFFWNGTEMIDLGTLGGFYSRGIDVNDAGHVVGIAQDTPYPFDGPGHAFIWDGTSLRDLGTFGGPNSIGMAINNRGQATGSADLPEVEPFVFYRHAFLWTNGTLYDLGTLGGPWSEGIDINDRGYVIGRSWAGDGTAQAFIWNGSEMIGLGFPEAVAINQSGQVAGASGSHAVLWDRGTVIDLGTLEGRYSFPQDLNEMGLVVGYATSIQNIFDRHAFVWDGLTMHDLNDLVRPSASTTTLRTARKVNNFAQILVNGSDPEVSGSRSYVLTPISLLFSRLLDDADIVPGSSLTNAAASAQAYYDADDLVGTCGALDLFRMKVLAHIGKKIPRATAEALIEDAMDIKDATGCQ